MPASGVRHRHLPPPPPPSSPRCTRRAATNNMTIQSFDANPPGGTTLNPGCITTKVGGPSFDRPNSTTAGIAALLDAVNGTGWENSSASCTNTPVSVTGQIDFARAARGPKSAGTTLTFVPYGRDALGILIYDHGDRALNTLTTAELTALYSSSTGTTTIGGDTVLRLPDHHRLHPPDQPRVGHRGLGHHGQHRGHRRRVRADPAELGQRVLHLRRRVCLQAPMRSSRSPSGAGSVRPTASASTAPTPPGPTASPWPPSTRWAFRPPDRPRPCSRRRPTTRAASTATTSTPCCRPPSCPGSPPTRRSRASSSERVRPCAARPTSTRSTSSASTA